MTKVFLSLIAAVCGAAALGFMAIRIWPAKTDTFGESAQSEAPPSTEHFTTGLDDHELEPRIANEQELNALKEAIERLETRLQVLERQPITDHAFPAPPPPIPKAPPMQLPDGSDAPWAWIEKLEPGKQASVEKVFEETATSARSNIPPPAVSPDDSTLEAAKENLDRELANRLRSILSPQEFEAYLASLPAALRTRVEAGTSGNR